MKHLLIITVGIIYAGTLNAQEYKNAWEVPDVVKLELKGKVKKVVSTTYSGKNIANNFVPDAVIESWADSFNTKGFSVLQYDNISGAVWKYNYDKTAKLESKVCKKNGVESLKELPHWINPYSYNVVTYKYADKEKKFMETSEVDKIKLNTNFLYDTYQGNVYDYMSRDTLIKKMNIGLTLSYITTERDKHNNPVKKIIYNNISTEKQIELITYEYYE